MHQLAPKFSIKSVEELGEVHFHAEGLWTMDTVRDFEAQMLQTLAPIIKQGKNLRFLSDLRGLVPQDREVSDAIRVLIDRSLELGNERTAIVTTSKLTELQHRRLNPQTNFEVFDDRIAALRWLRAA